VEKKVKNRIFFGDVGWKMGNETSRKNNSHEPPRRTPLRPLTVTSAHNVHPFLWGVAACSIIPTLTPAKGGTNL